MTKPQNTELQEQRDRVDAIDQQLRLLLLERFDIAKTIHRLKQEAGLPLQDSNREAQILALCAVASPNALHSTALAAVFEELLQQSRTIQQKQSGDAKA